MTVTLKECDVPDGTQKQESTIASALLTGGFDRPYAYGVATSLASKNVHVDVIGSDAIDGAEMHTNPNLTFINVWPARTSKRGFWSKVSRTLKHYRKLFRYAAGAKPKVFHILWNSKILLIDRTLVMLYYKALGKKVVLTAHNVNKEKRDAHDTWLNRKTLQCQYLLTDHIFVHTEKMKDELVADFGVRTDVVTVIPYGVDNVLPDSALTSAEAKVQLSIAPEDKAILCFGRIKPYKGIEHLLAAFQKLNAQSVDYRLIIAGEVQKGNEAYLQNLEQLIARLPDPSRVMLKAEFIPDAAMEVYFKAADVLVLPYNDIFQSGVLFLAYSFGLPVVATDVGSFRSEIVEGVTGYVCKARDADDLARVTEAYFESNLYRTLDEARVRIQRHINETNSWSTVADITRRVYCRLLERQR